MVQSLSGRVFCRSFYSMNQMNIQRQNRFSSYSHLCGAIIALVGTMTLVYQTRDCLSLIIVSTIYGLSGVFMLLSSALYHAFKTGENQASFLRKMDHFAIFCMIAGFFLKLFYIRAPRLFTTIIYLLMGWMAIVPIKQLLSVVPLASLILLFMGGIAYSIGSVIYILKKPNPIPGLFGFHEIFHFFILIGVFLHFPVVFLAVSSAC